jgi:hypothetical protein
MCVITYSIFCTLVLQSSPPSGRFGFVGLKHIPKGGTIEWWSIIPEATKSLFGVIAVSEYGLFVQKEGLLDEAFMSIFKPLELARLTRLTKTGISSMPTILQ